MALLFSAGLSTTASAFTVFACEPEWAALIRVLLPQAKLHVATHSRQDPHHIEARPALIAQLRSADLAVCTGASLEAGWLPVLQQRAGKARDSDVFFAADVVKLMDPQPGAIGTPWAGDVHAEGNPHLHTDPHNLITVADALAERLQQSQPAQKAAIEQRRAAFSARLKSQISQWETRAQPLRGRQVVAQHTSFGYLWKWLGITQVADLEPKPGMAPTPGHLQSLLNTLNSKPPMAVVISSYQDPRPGRWLSGQWVAASARHSGDAALSAGASPAVGPGMGAVPLLVLPATVAEDADGEALIRWFDGLLQTLLAASTPAAR